MLISRLQPSRQICASVMNSPQVSPLVLNPMEASKNNTFNNHERVNLVDSVVFCTMLHVPHIDRALRL